MPQSGHAGRAVLDGDVLEFATGEHRAVVTLNRRHVVRLHQDRPGHAGIIVCTSISISPRWRSRYTRRSSAAPPLPGQLLRVNRDERCISGDPEG